MQEVTIIRDRSKINVDFVHAYLTQSYWAKGRTREKVLQSMENSLCFGVFTGEEQIGFARLVTDSVVFAWLMDVFVIDGFKGRGIGTRLIEYILKQPEVQHVNGIGLRTNDAHGLYEKFGFEKIVEPETWMLKKNE
ncbi:GNAT family N-acetyltransferase [Flavobacteriaceae bacterium TP-CH-4]|uniref:GNAT family N-acetyltransferase n=1 Tax=Pelagihabitans pacificus TaxID=2696054 RepID=A0A967B123_9FLAO|nr:GNAT family N-acetyltransferase [Pelagihabitans pacificus]NHF60146.1 GNAT family N-acetyltransferase [Pelagihabitans pacificus]